MTSTTLELDDLVSQLETSGWLDDGLVAELDGWRETAEDGDDPFAASPRSTPADVGGADVFVRLVPQPDGWFWTMDLARPPGEWPQP